MAKKKVVLNFPQETITLPITYKLVKDYDLVINILRAQIREEETGTMVLELEGSRENIEKGLKFLKSQKVKVQEAGKDIELIEKLCIDCGACTAVCPTEALKIGDPEWKLEFNREDCILCELCVKSCPTQIISVSL